MKKLLIALLLICLPFSGSITAQTKYAVEPPTRNDFVPLLYQLADASMQGRETGTEGGRKAAALIATKFAEAGIQSFYESYYQSFGLIKTSVSSAGLAVESAEEGLKSIADFPGEELFLLSCADDFNVSSSLVFAGYGLLSADSTYNSFANLDAKNKVVVVLEGVPGEADTTGKVWQTFGRAFANEGNLLKMKRNTAKNFGATALVVLRTSQKTDSFVQWVSDITGDDWVNYPDSDYWFDDNRQNACVPVALCNYNNSRNIANLLQINLESAISALTQSTKAGFAEQKPLITQLWAKLKREQTEARNVIGMIKGVDTTRTIVIGGHYDHLGMRGEHIYHGADDNASGASGVVALARKWAENNTTPQCNLVFACWDGEEKGLFGSRYFVNHLTEQQKVSTKLYFNMDMISRSAEEDSLRRVVSVGIRAQDTGLIQMVQRCNTITNSAFDLDVWDVNGHSGSDYAGFKDNSIPVMTFFSGFHSDYHSPRDTKERTDPVKMEKILKLVNECIQHVHY